MGDRIGIDAAVRQTADWSEERCFAYLEDRACDYTLTVGKGRQGRCSRLTMHFRDVDLVAPRLLDLVRLAVAHHLAEEVSHFASPVASAEELPHHDEANRLGGGPATPTEKPVRHAR